MGGQGDCVQCRLGIVDIKPVTRVSTSTAIDANVPGRSKTAVSSWCCAMNVSGGQQRDTD